VSLAPRDLDSRGGCEGSPLWATASPSVTARSFVSSYLDRNRALEAAGLGE
jgi:hypothetical protein